MTSIATLFRRHGPLFRFLIGLAWIASLGVAFLAGVFAYRHRNQIRAFINSSISGAGVIQANLYNISVETLPIPGEGRDGGIDALGDGLLLVNRLGATWFVTTEGELRKLELEIPINFEEFEADPFNVNTNRREQFAVKDILIQELEGELRLLASYNYWYTDRDCYALRVSGLEATAEELREGSETLEDRWATLFETTPCRQLGENPDGVHRNPTIGAGGRLEALSEHEFLVTVGGFGPEEVTAEAIGSQSRDNSYGKTILFDVKSGASRIYTIGHRNPQGLALGADGSIWLTEHGARGGDELNLIVEGRNYGFPVVSYGTEYESMTWGDDPRQGHHEGFEKPTFAWVPSIGVSQLVVLEGQAFPHWRDDLIVSGMANTTLHRLRLEDGKVILVEPIPVGHRPRDIVEMRDGTIAVKTDDDFLLFLRPVDPENMTELPPEDRGKIIASACAGCHSLTPDGVNAIGPSLWGIVGRDIAADEGFTYSEALESLGGSWTPARLRAYVANPDSVAPGTTMTLTATYDPETLDDLLAFLETLR